MLAPHKTLYITSLTIYIGVMVDYSSEESEDTTVADEKNKFSTRVVVFSISKWHFKT